MPKASGGRSSRTLAKKYTRDRLPSVYPDLVTKIDPATAKKKRRSKLKTIVNAIQFYDGDKLGFPLAEYRGKGHFQGINKGDTVDGGCWPHINGHKKYAKIYRVTSIRHTIEEKPDGTIKHLKSVFVDPVV